MNIVLRLTTGTLVDCRVYRELCACELLVFNREKLPLVFRRLLKFALSSGDCRLLVADHTA